MRRANPGCGLEGKLFVKVLLIVVPLLTGVLATIGVFFALGVMLPRSHRAAMSLKLAASPERVWSLISDMPKVPSWWPEVTGVVRREDGVWDQTIKGGWKMPLRVEDEAAPTRRVTRIADEDLPFGGIWTFEIVPEGGGCVLTITEDGEVKNALFRAMSLLMGHDKTIRSYLTHAAKALSETAEPVRIVPA